MLFNSDDDSTNPVSLESEEERTFEPESLLQLSVLKISSLLGNIEFIDELDIPINLKKILKEHNIVSQIKLRRTNAFIQKNYVQ